MNIRTDLALENQEDLSQRGICKEGVLVNIDENLKDIILTQVQVVNKDGERSIGKPMGNYVTIEFREYQDDLSKISQLLSEEIKKIVKVTPDENFTTLVVGLGNWNITPDALGPKVVSKLMITKHIFTQAKEFVNPNMSQVCAFSPGVLGITGIESGEIVKGIVEEISPNLIIAIDALAARKIERICSTIQLTDTGIIPGSGVNNNRKGLNRDTLGVPVIALGVPTVVEASTVANDTIDHILDRMIAETTSGEDFYQMLSDFDREEKEVLIKELLRPFVGELLVTPKDVDQNITDLSAVIADAINIALHPNMKVEEMNSYIN